MATITMRPVAGEADLQPIVDFVNACDAVDQLDDSTSLDELRNEFASPSFDRERDVRLWQDDEDKLVAYGQLWRPHTSEAAEGFIWFKVHPEARGAGLEEDVIRWAEERMREVGRESGKPAQLRSGARETNTERIRTLEANGFTVARYFFRMTRPLDEPIPEPQFPVGFTLRHLQGPEEAQAWVDCFNQSFIDHYNHHDIPVADRLHWMTESIYKAEQDLIAVAPDGTFAAVCYCSINKDDNELHGRNEGWINILGTRRGYRKIGLGRAMLLAGLHRLKADGVDTAKLGVDAANPTGALRLYESVGFRQQFTSRHYVKEL